MSESLDDLLGNLKQKYIEDLPVKIKCLNQSLQDEDQEKLVEIFHKLKGTGKTYGISQVTDVCHLGEQAALRTDYNKSDIIRLIQLLNGVYESQIQDSADNEVLSQNSDFLTLSQKYHD